MIKSAELMLGKLREKLQEQKETQLNSIQEDFYYEISRGRREILFRNTLVAGVEEELLTLGYTVSLEEGPNEAVNCRISI